MVLWIILAAMAALAAVWVLRPLLRPARSAGRRADFELAIRRDQLDEIDRDLEREVIGPAEAEAARAEVGRRLIAASEAAKAKTDAPDRRRLSRAAAVAVIVLVPALSGGLYVTLGSPGLSGAPFAARSAAPVGERSLADLVGEVERHLQANPTDAEGWQVLGPAYMRLGRYEAAADAFAHAVDLGGPTPQLLASLGEARVFAAQGMVDARARQAFARAAELDSELMMPAFYLGLAALQDGDAPGAVARWQALAERLPAEAPLRGMIERQIAEARGEPPAALPGPGEAELEAAEELAPADRATMIEGMVAGLAERLDTEGGSAAEWVRLIRSYVVLGRTDEALSSLAKARAALAGDSAGLATVDAAARTLGLEG